jgi:hypothetical protein
VAEHSTPMHGDATPAQLKTRGDCAGAEATRLTVQARAHTPYRIRAIVDSGPHSCRAKGIPEAAREREASRGRW